MLYALHPIDSVSSSGSYRKQNKRSLLAVIFILYFRKEDDIMALIKCPECELQVSDKALSCPHCGYPMKSSADAPKGRGKAKPKHRRLPNGFGSITELKNRNLRNRFWCRACIGKTPYGKPILKPLKPDAQILWDNVEKVKFADWIIIQCYMGWRPQELATLRLEEVNLDEWYMCAGMKTDAGKQRIVPIHSKIQSLVKKNYDYAVEIGSEYLLNDKGQTHAGSWKLTYDKYANRFKKVIDELKLDPEHRAHDPRKTFITRCKKNGSGRICIERNGRTQHKGYHRINLHCKGYGMVEKRFGKNAIIKAHQVLIYEVHFFINSY